MLESLSIETASAVCTIISTVAVVFSAINLLISKYDALQVRFTNDNEKSISTITIRNMSSKTVYIDHVELYRCKSHSINLVESLKTKSLAIESGKDFSFGITSEELQQFVSELCSKSHRVKFDSYRLPVKIYVKSSKGNLLTPWFEVTKRREDTYDNAPIFGTYNGYDLSFHPLRRNISVYAYWWLFAVAISAHLISIAALIEDPKADNVLYALVTQIITIIAACLYASGGFERPIYVPMLSLVIISPFAIAIYYATNELVVSMAFGFLFFIVVFIEISRMSGRRLW